MNFPAVAISDATVARLKEALPPFAILRNPIDITGFGGWRAYLGRPSP